MLPKLTVPVCKINSFNHVSIHVSVITYSPAARADGLLASSVVDVRCEVDGGNDIHLSNSINQAGMCTIQISTMDELPQHAMLVAI